MNLQTEVLPILRGVNVKRFNLYMTELLLSHTPFTFGAKRVCCLATQAYPKDSPSVPSAHADIPLVIMPGTFMAWRGCQTFVGQSNRPIIHAPRTLVPLPSCTWGGSKAAKEAWKPVYHVSELVVWQHDAGGQKQRDSQGHKSMEIRS